MLKPLIEALRKSVPMLVRSAPSTDDYLEGVLSREDLQRCDTLLRDALGPPVKEFGKAAAIAPAMRALVDRIGGVRIEQCLFLRQDEAGQVTYAALWPWASDEMRITLKVGVDNLK